MTNTIVLSVLSVVFVVLSFFAGKQRTSNKDSEKLGMFQGSITEKVDNISKNIERLEEKIDNFSKSYNNEIDRRIKEHERVWHNAGK